MTGPAMIPPSRQVAAEQARRQALADQADDDGELVVDEDHDPNATPIDIDDYGAVRSGDWHRGFVDGLLFNGGCGPYSDGSWRSTHPQCVAARERREQWAKETT